MSHQILRTNIIEHILSCGTHGGKMLSLLNFWIMHSMFEHYQGSLWQRGPVVKYNFSLAFPILL